ncbi:MAG: PaaI family thioesterase [candidate division NC10 bacterium]
MDLTAEEKHLLEHFRSLGEEGRAEVSSLAKRLAAQGKKTKPPHFRDLIGQEVVRVEGGQTEVLIQVTPFLLNRAQVLHGGVICTLMDEAIGWAVYNNLEEGSRAVTAEIKINFLAAATSGTITGRGRVIRQGKNLVTGEGDLFDQEGNHLARGLGTWMIIQPQS